MATSSQSYKEMNTMENFQVALGLHVPQENGCKGAKIINMATNNMSLQHAKAVSFIYFLVSHCILNTHMGLFMEEN